MLPHPSAWGSSALPARMMPAEIAKRTSLSNFRELRYCEVRRIRLRRSSTTEDPTPPRPLCALLSAWDIGPGHFPLRLLGSRLRLSWRSFARGGFELG